MKLSRMAALAVTLIIAATALAQVEEQREMNIVIAGTSSDDSTTVHWIGSDDSGFDMQGMQVGETQSIVDESGRSVLITRQEEGFRFDIDGETVLVPDMGAHGEYLTLTDGSDVTADFDVEFVGNPYATPTFGNTGVTIISGEPLDATTRESIKAVLQSAGRNDEVTYIDHSGDSHGRQIQMIRKKVEVTQ